MNFRYPVFLDLTAKRCLVTGEGAEIPFKVRSLVEAGADVTYINPQAEPGIAALAASGALRWLARDFDPSDLQGCFLVISDCAGNAAIFQQAEEQGTLCNSVDDPENCRFSFGSLLRRGELTVAISTNGWAPAVAVRIRERLEREIGSEYTALLELLKQVRPEIASRLADFTTRRDLWYRIVDSAALDKLRMGDRAAAERLIRALVDDALSSTSRSDISAGADPH